ncbi:MAG: M1 family metallopeptidase [Bacteroidetes bacterium]|nr:M1 family metallopeptidase [Bacteroidota bacterium]
MKVQSVFISFLLVLFSFQLAAQGDYYNRNLNIDILHYAFQLELSDETDKIQGKADIKVHFLDTVSVFQLDFIEENSTGKGMKVQSVSFDQQEISFLQDSEKIKILLPDSLKMKGIYSFQIDYSGIPKDGLIISSNKFGARTFFGDNWPDRARHWLPTIDHPSDKASVEFMVTAPDHYQVVANGVQIEETNLDENLKFSHWITNIPISTKVMVIGVAPFAVQYLGDVEDIPVYTWVFPQNRAEGFLDYDVAQRVLDYFNSHIGDYPYEKLANVQSKTRYGGMENAGNIFYYENSVTGNQEVEALIAHEIAHQWFGNSATEKSWHHIWLSEGFATYFADVYMEFYYGVDVLKKRLAQEREKVIQYYSRNPSPIINPKVKDYNYLLNPNSYEKGAWFLHMLRQKIGDENFWKSIQSYYTSYKNSNALTSDFEAIVEDVSGQPLDAFFQQWLYQAGFPQIELDWKYDENNKKLDVFIRQLNTSLFSFPLEIQLLFTNSNTESFVRELSIENKKHHFSIPAKEAPFEVMLDPFIKLLYSGQVNQLK